MQPRRGTCPATFCKCQELGKERLKLYWPRLTQNDLCKSLDERGKEKVILSLSLFQLWPGWSTRRRGMNPFEFFRATSHSLLSIRTTCGGGHFKMHSRTAVHFCKRRGIFIFYLNVNSSTWSLIVRENSKGCLSENS